MWFSTGKPHPLATRPTIEITVGGASAYNVSDTEVIGDYILYWVGDPMVTHRNEGTLCTIYLIAWKEGWTTEVRLCPTSAARPSATQHVSLASLEPRGHIRFRAIGAIGRDRAANSDPRTCA